MNLNPPHRGSGRYKRWFCQGMLWLCLLVILSGAVLYPQERTSMITEAHETVAAPRGYPPAELKLVSPLQWDGT